MPFEESFKQLLDVGVGGLLTRPDLLLDVVVGVVGKLAETESTRKRVEDLEQIVEAQNKQMDNTKRAINLLYKQCQANENGGGGGDPVSMGVPEGQVKTLTDRLDRIERMNDIMSERMSINQALVEKIQKAEANNHNGDAQQPNDTLSIQVHQHSQALFLMEQKMDVLFKGADDLQKQSGQHNRAILSIEAKVEETNQDDWKHATESVKREMKTLEKKLVGAMSTVASKIDGEKSENDGVVHHRIRQIEEKAETLSQQLKNSVTRPELNQTFENYIQQCTIAWGDELQNIYKLFELSKADVLWACQGDAKDKLQVLHALPCFQGLSVAVSKLGKSLGFQGPPVQQFAPPPQITVNTPPAAAPQHQQQQQQQQPAPALSVMTGSSANVLNQSQPGSHAPSSGKQFPVVGLEILDGRSAGQGVQVLSVLPNSPAEAAGISPGDNLLSFNGVATDTRSAFMAATLKAQPNTQASICRSRQGGQPEIVTITLGVSSISPSAVQQLRRNSHLQKTPASQSASPWR